MRQAALHLQHQPRHFVANGDLPPGDAVAGGAICAGGFGFLDAWGGVGARGVRLVAFEALH